MEFGSKESSDEAMYLPKVVESSLVCSILLVAGHEGRRSVLLGRHAVEVRGHRGCGLESGLAVRARRPAILEGVDMTSAMQSTCCSYGYGGVVERDGGSMHPRHRGLLVSFSQSPESRVQSYLDEHGATMALSHDVSGRKYGGLWFENRSAMTHGGWPSRKLSSDP